jgi:hypothetical protein
MSMDRCALCERFVDTDEDGDAYVEGGEFGHTCVCEACREEHMDEDGNLTIKFKEKVT